MKLLSNLLILVLILLSTACSTEEQCHKNNYVALNLGIYHVTVNNATGARTTSNLKIDSITVKGIGIDSLLYNNTKSVTSLALPLKNSGSSNVISTFEITFNQTKDTITVIHENQTTFLSLECGSVITHKIDTVLTTNHFLDSVKISVHDVNISTSAKENIKLYN